MKKMTNKMDNKGFSLVELIIVIAIMAILIGVVGSQVIPYIEKSRVSKDKNVVDTCYTAFQAAVAKEGVPQISGVKLDDMKTLTKVGSTETMNLTDEIVESIGNGITDNTALKGKFGSKAYADGEVQFWFDPTDGFIAVSVKGPTGADKKGQALIISSVKSKEYAKASEMVSSLADVKKACGVTTSSK